MDVLKTSSPVCTPTAPKPTPGKVRPSSSASNPCMCVLPLTPAPLPRNAGVPASPGRGENSLRYDDYAGGQTHRSAPTIRWLSPVMSIDGYVIVAEIARPDYCIESTLTTVQQNRNRRLIHDFSCFSFAIVRRHSILKEEQIFFRLFAGRYPQVHRYRVN